MSASVNSPSPHPGMGAVPFEDGVSFRVWEPRCAVPRVQPVPWVQRARPIRHSRWSLPPASDTDEGGALLLCAVCCLLLCFMLLFFMLHR